MDRQKVILLVEDNQQDEYLTIRALKKHNVPNDIVICRDGAAAVDWLFAKGDHKGRDLNVEPQVVLLDLKLPKLDGIEVLTQIRNNQKTKRIPVVMLTTSVQDSDIDRSYDNGANSYVQKPVNYDDFSEVIKKLGVYWLNVNESPNLPHLGSA